MTVFNCDICGTYQSSNNINRENNIQKFVYELNKVCNNLNIKDLPFRFFSTADLKYVQLSANELRPYLYNTPIRITSLFSEDYQQKDDIVNKTTSKVKTNQIINKIEADITNNKQLERIIYADDQYLNVIIIKNYIELTHPEIEFIGLIPGYSGEVEENIYASIKTGLEGLIETIESYNNLLENKKNNSLKR